MGTSTNLGTGSTPSTVIPVIKRATGTLSDGSVVVMVPDVNSASGHGVDTTGVAKIRFYKSDTTRTTWALNFTWTPATVFGSTTFQAVMSMVLDSANNIHVVWAGTNNSLNYCLLTFGSGTWTAGTLQNIVASNAVTRRYRAVAIDVVTGTSGSTASLVITAYEGKTSAGLSAWVRVFARKNDNTTWVNCYTEDFATYSGGALTIKPFSEDTSVSCSTGGLSSNVFRFLIAYTRMTSTLDYGDQIRELTFNVSTGAAATVAGTWPVFNKGVGSPYRRIWIYKISATLWQVAFATGASQPQFSVARLTSGAYSTPSQDIINSSGSVGAAKNMTIYTKFNGYSYVATSFVDNQVIFGFMSTNVPAFQSNAQVSCLGAVTFTYAGTTNVNVLRKDLSMRPLDNYFVQSSSLHPIAIYGAGNNRNLGGDHSINFYTVLSTDAATATYPLTGSYVRVVCDSPFPAPLSVSPSTTQATNSPTLQAVTKSTVSYPLAYGKLEWQIASDAAFATNLHDIIEPDSAFKYMGSLTSASPSLLTTVHVLSGVAPEKLFSGTWYIRSRVLSDLGQIGAWSATASFLVSHPPTAVPLSPTNNSVIEYGTGVPYFSWTFSDLEASDSQTGYIITVTDLSSGTVYTSGAILSTINSGTIPALPTSIKDLPLIWQVQLYDGDTVLGPASNPIAFSLSDPPTVLWTDPVDLQTETSAAPTVQWAFTSPSTRAQQAFRTYVDACVDADWFARTVANGWGTSPMGSAWNIVSGASSNFNTDGVHATLFIGNVVAAFRGAVGSVPIADSDQIVRVQTNVVSTGAATGAKLFARWIDVSNFIVAGVELKIDGTYTSVIQVNVAGTNVVNVANGVTTGPKTYSINTDIFMRLRVVGTNIYLKTWTAGSPEPNSWDITSTSTANTLGPGMGGLYAIQFTGCTNTTTLFSFSDYSVINAYPAVSHAGDSGWVTSALQSYQYASNVLQLGQYYRFVVDVRDTANLQGSARSVAVTSWIHPALANFQVTTDDYSAIITWDNSTQDTDFNSWRVWRRYNVAASSDLDLNDTRDIWVLVAEIQDGASTNFKFTDYLAPLTKPIDYVVTQTADRFGSLIDSSITSFTTVTLPSNRYFFVPDQAVGSIASFMAHNVTGDNFTDETEQQTILVVDRGNQVQVGTDMGISGTLSIQLRDTALAQRDREFFTYLAKNGVGCYMKNPFGVVAYIKLSPPSVTLMAGVGNTELSDLSMAYVESYRKTVRITRVS